MRRAACSGPEPTKEIAMKSRLIAAVTAAAVALGGLAATPADAWSKREQDALKIILGAAAVGVIINQLDKQDRNDRARRAPVHDAPFGYDDGYYRDRGDWRRHDDRQVRRSHRVPEECVYDIRTSNGRRDVVSASCMRQFGLSRGLPRECAFEIRTRKGNTPVYGPNCLESHGWRVAGRR
jgi:hypothetical protein